MSQALYKRHQQLVVTRQKDGQTACSPPVCAMRTRHKEYTHISQFRTRQRGMACGREECWEQKKGMAG
jgi:hypothetical protein